MFAYTPAFLLFPLSVGGGVSLYRSEALSRPSVLLARHLPWPAAPAFVALLIVSYLGMTSLLFSNTLV